VTAARASQHPHSPLSLAAGRLRGGAVACDALESIVLDRELGDESMAEAMAVFVTLASAVSRLATGQ